MCGHVLLGVVFSRLWLSLRGSSFAWRCLVRWPFSSTVKRSEVSCYAFDFFSVKNCLAFQVLLVCPEWRPVFVSFGCLFEASGSLSCPGVWTIVSLLWVLAADDIPLFIQLMRRDAGPWSSAAVSRVAGSGPMTNQRLRGIHSGGEGSLKKIGDRFCY
ncbi:hypothetical protein Bca101_012870 [Brassica carinata]